MKGVRMSSLPSEVRDYLKRRVRLTRAQLEWLDERYERAQAGDVDDWYVTFFLQEGTKRRLIEAPCKELRGIQRKILDRVLYRFAISDQAHGFAKDRSPVTNAQAHLAHRETLKKTTKWCALMVDVKDFFHNIRASTVWKIFAKLLEKRSAVHTARTRSTLADLLTNLCTKDERLPMGAPTSPALSNIAMIPFDRKVSKWCKKRRRLYTRYADDIVVSGPRANNSFSMLEDALKQMNLEMNPKKTRVLRDHRAVEVTGVVINSGLPTVSRKYRRRLRAALHQTQLSIEGVTPTKELRTELVSRLIGQATWCAFVNQKHTPLLAQAREIKRLQEEAA